MGSRGWQDFSTPRRRQHCNGNSASKTLATCASKSQLLSRTSSYHPDMQRRSVDDESSTCNKVRERYLHRLGTSSMNPGHFNVDNNQIISSTPEKASYIEQQQSSNKQDKIISTSLPEKASSLEQQQNQKDSIDCDEDNIILLRQSIKYTTELKPDLNEFELSSAWSKLLSSNDTSRCQTPSPPKFGTRRLSRKDTASSTSLESASYSSMTSGLPSFDNLSSTSSMQRRRKVSFDTTVHATTIPSRHDYSDQARAAMWTNQAELYREAFRNDLEYEFDGRKAQSVSEEVDFIRCSLTPPSSSTIEEMLVHPVHFLPTSPWKKANTPQHSTLTSASVNCQTEEFEDDDYTEGVFEMD